MLLRLLHSVIFGVGLASCLAISFFVALQLYLHFIWVPPHPGIGTVHGGLIYPAMWLMLPAFLAGFLWDWWISSPNKSCGHVPHP
jgi:hypothetical protein